jgi:hypothetical protein
MTESHRQPELQKRTTDDAAMACAAARRELSDRDRQLLRGHHVRLHLRTCPVCSAFAEAIAARRRSLKSLARPLPRSDAIDVFARVVADSAGVGKVESGPVDGRAD